ncbi:GT-D fold domain-containing protein [Dethiobacter alkaliphilus]|uniref:GT-D fold domain-containing protein n=1 Tax=Dethiobacter alkaliphilus TaxID=427926 RepID=UPI002225CFE6|nr:GT-D fold domain-containing glycosyltransferase [Dethiobacter alkaliphilus]MCW3489254.1 GT-D fold domain-containing glycosyltransferase [Dethiobacter alkaliphilus]
MRNSEKALQRSKLIQEQYQREALNAEAVNALVEEAIINRKGLSVIRLGDAMARLLMMHNIKSLDGVAHFLGIPYPPGKKFILQLRNTIVKADVVGVSHFKGGSKLLKQFMHKKKWSPPHLTESFINDQLYYEGYLNYYLRKYRVCLIGRAAKKASQQLQEQGTTVALVLPLDNYREIKQVLKALHKKKTDFDLVLIGAGVPGRTLCIKIAKQLHKPAIEIGHMMDAMAEPEDWAKPGNRLRFKRRWLSKKKTE